MLINGQWAEKEKGSQENLQTLDINGEPCKIRTCDPLIKSFNSSINDQTPVPSISPNHLDFLRKRFETVC